MLIRVEEYQRDDGSSPFRNWFDRLPAQAAAKVATYLLRVEHGNTGAIKWFSGVGEVRIDWGSGYRVYLVRDGESLVVLLGGGTKASQSKDITRALALLGEYKARKRSANRATRHGRKE
jgi:putative addiction module killer protein